MTYKPSHRHVDPCDPDETYGMPSQACMHCGAECCVDCATPKPTTEDRHALLCDICESWLAMTEEERAAATQ